MAKNRVIYQSQAVYAGRDKNAAGDTGWQSESGSVSAMPKQLKRVQSANYGFDIARTDVNQFGELAAIDRIILTSPTVSMDFSYILANVSNESILGFDTGGSTSAIADIINKTKDERNYFIKTSAAVKAASDGLPPIIFTILSPAFSKLLKSKLLLASKSDIEL